MDGIFAGEFPGAVEDGVMGTERGVQMPRVRWVKEPDKPRRRLDLSLPEDHPIWSYPRGRRSDRARELLDLALRLEHGFAALEERLARIETEQAACLLGEGQAACLGAGEAARLEESLARLEAGLARLEERLARLEEMTAAGRSAAPGGNAGADGGNMPDPLSFLGAFG